LGSAAGSSPQQRGRESKLPQEHKPVSNNVSAHNCYEVVIKSYRPVYRAWQRAGHGAEKMATKLGFLPLQLIRK
jgi:hypothetical protein